MTELLAADSAGIARAAALLLGGELVAFGTETVYGLGARAADAMAVARIYEAKGRPRFNPLICHYSSADAAFGDVLENDMARALAARFWPGPLTLVLPRRPTCQVSLLAGAGLPSLAVRVPSAAVAATLLAAVGEAVAAPSANRSGRISPTRAEHVMAELGGRIAAILDSGPCPVGVESTVLDLTGPPALLRHGGVPREAIEAAIGPLAEATAPAAAPRAPGQLASHYAPALPLRLEATGVSADEALLAFGPPLVGAGAVFQLSAGRDTVEAAARLFDGLRWLDAEGAARGLRGIAAMPVPGDGLGAAIKDRLARAAAPR
ncbi:MAG: threonylcarbamoyl-AMP synthase [Rhodospirillales bacterium]|nr:threonylcarbamoyl-AMP synthase [Rhodospirillales bacterium]